MILERRMGDIGANLTHESFADDRTAVIARAADAGVTAKCDRRGSASSAARRRWPLPSVPALEHRGCIPPCHELRSGVAEGCSNCCNNRSGCGRDAAWTISYFSPPAAQRAASSRSSRSPSHADARVPASAIHMQISMPYSGTFKTPRRGSRALFHGRACGAGRLSGARLCIGSPVGVR